MQVNQGNLTQSSEDLFITGKYLNSFYLILLFLQWTGDKQNLLTELVIWFCNTFKSRRQSLPPLRKYDYWGIFNCVLLSSFNLNANSICLILSSTCCLTLCWHKYDCLRCCNVLGHHGHVMQSVLFPYSTGLEPWHTLFFSLQLVFLLP